jgi:acyl-CoA oxidase
MPLPGVDVGDIGPKYGFITKDNGFLMLKNVRIPRKNMLRRYVSITETGDLKLKGNPKIAYATMMLMRKLIACGYYKVLGQAVTIAGKYSLIRKQFKDDSGKEIKILDYQLQQNKILSCLADYYAMAINGRILTNLADQNFELVTEKDDDSLMKETHNCLCLGKALSTDLIVKDIEICRLACGGHGFHQYSGLPSLLQEISPFTTL